LPENNAWHVVNVATNSPPETPFIISRNMKASALAYPTQSELDDPEKNAVLIPLDKKVKFFVHNSGVWVTRGGGTIDAPRKHLTRARVVPVPQPDGQPPLTILPAQGGFW